MDYVYDVNIISKSEELISKIAASQYSETGQSLYDSIVVKSSDASRLVQMLADSVGSITVRFADICIETPTGLQFIVPEMVEANQTRAKKELDNYLIYSVVASWCADKVKEMEQQYSALAVEAINKAAVLLKTRKFPTRK